MFLSKGEEKILTEEKSILIPIKEIEDFPKHPFKVKDDEEMKELILSVKRNGIIHPAIIRKIDDNKYEMISGHRRKKALEMSGIKFMPCIVKDLTDDEATILMVDSNIQREEILPSEKAFAYKMKLDAVAHQGRTTSRQLVEKLVSADLVGEQYGISGRQVQRYIRLTELIPDLLKLVDEKVIALSPAVEISYLAKDEQYILSDCIVQYDATPSQAQAIRLKRLSQEGNLTADKIEEIISEEKPNQKLNYKISYERFEGVIPRDVVTQKEVEDYLYLCAKEHQDRQRKRQLER